VTKRESGGSLADELSRDPFGPPSEVPVNGGTLMVSHAEPPVDQAEVVVLAIHGITGNGLVWRAVAREVTRNAPVSVYAPDLRGRGGSVGLPGPYGIATHVADMLAVLDHVGAQQAVLVGHSMGAYVASRIAAEHPERTAGLVLVDGGTAVSELSKEDANAAHAYLVGPALARHAMPFMSAAAYLEFWRHHPAFADVWNDDIEAYLLHDLIGKPGAFRYVMSVQAVAVDSEEMTSNRGNRDAINRLRMPMHLLRAQRGALGDEHPLISQSELDAFAAQHPAAEIDEVRRVNHYSLVLGDTPGPSRVAAAIESAARSAMTA
jgi:lipase